MEKLPLRERKKIQTRQRILHAAEKLVGEQGYQSTTIAAICDEAEIAVRTFFAYFPSKEAVFFYDKQQLYDYIADKLTNRPDGQTTFQALRELLSPAIDQYLINSSPNFIQRELDSREYNQQFQMYSKYLGQQFETLFRQCLALDLDEPKGSLSVKLAAAATNTTLETIMSQQNIQKSGVNKEAIIETLDKALSFLEGGISTLRKYEKNDRLST